MTAGYRALLIGQFAVVVIAILEVLALNVTGSRGKAGAGMRAFSSDAELNALLSKLPGQVFHDAVPEIADASAEATDAPAAMKFEQPPGIAPDGITNAQTKGVDEGGIVKKRGDMLVVLRRGRLFTISTANNALTPIDRINAFPGDSTSGSEAWYDELLIAGNMAIVIGYSYGREGTEINRFRLDDDGKLIYRDTHYLRSNDYYSSDNYASRLIGTELIVYAPLAIGNGMILGDALPALAPWNGEKAKPRFTRYADASDIHLAEPYWTNPPANVDTLHTVSRCDLAAETLSCDATSVIGSWSRSFYVSQTAVYIWTSAVDRDGDSNAAFLYRIPLDGGRPQSVRVAGSPIDQFSFLERDGVLHVLTQDEGDGDAMGGPMAADGSDLALLSLPLSTFGGDGGSAKPELYAALPPVRGYAIRNRFVGEHLIYAGAGDGDQKAKETAVAVWLRDKKATGITPGHDVTRIDSLGSDAVLIGGGRSGLTFTSVQLDGPKPAIANRHSLAGAEEGESRNHAFFFRADPATPDGASGVLGLPITRGDGEGSGRLLGSSGSILFLRRDDRTLRSAGELRAMAKGDEDRCLASCTDWYGNARPIFAGNRIFGLLGYELVEGRIDGPKIAEVRRADFTPKLRDLRKN